MLNPTPQPPIAGCGEGEKEMGVQGDIILSCCNAGDWEIWQFSIPKSPNPGPHKPSQ